MRFLKIYSHGNKFFKVGAYVMGRGGPTTIFNNYIHGEREREGGDGVWSGKFPRAVVEREKFVGEVNPCTLGTPGVLLPLPTFLPRSWL